MTVDGDSVSDDGIDDRRPNETEEDAKNRKRKERLEQNRISARESRKRKKSMIEELQRTVIALSRENKELNERNEKLRRQLMDIGQKVRSFKPSWLCFPCIGILPRLVKVTSRENLVVG
jgi:predicted RNase H-like nuclease (RuvC/YqgF family)